MPKLVPTADMIAAVKKVFAAMGDVQAIKPVVTAYREKVLDAGQYRVRSEFADDRESSNIITNPAHAYLMSESDFIDYCGRCEGERIAAGLTVKKLGNCPLLEAEEALRQAEVEMLDALNPLTNLKAKDYQLLPRDKYRECVDLALRMLAPFANRVRTRSIPRRIAA
jgi:hypothetical protein